MGIDYNCQIDGDVLCNRRFDLSFLDSADIYGVKKKCDKDMNSGVIWYRCDQMRKIGFYDRCLQLYKDNNFPGDQDLIHTFAMNFTNYGNLPENQQLAKVKLLDCKYNLLMKPTIERFIESNDGAEEVIADPSCINFIHFIGVKPWAFIEQHSIDPIFASAHRRHYQLHHDLDVLWINFYNEFID